MQFSVALFDPEKQESDCLVVAILANGQLSASAKLIDDRSGGYLSKIVAQGDLAEECGQALLLYSVPNIAAKRLLLVSCGKEVGMSDAAFRKVLLKTVMTLKTTKVQQVAYCLADFPVAQRNLYWKIRLAAEILAEGLYHFDAFKSNKKPLLLEQLVFNVAAADETLAQQAVVTANALVSGINFAKSLANLPGNICTPTYLAEQALLLAETFKTIKTTVLDQAALQELGMGAFLAVAQGSCQPPKLITLEYNGVADSQKPIVLIGKGITFDSGGVSLKPGLSMSEMKFDMCGAAAVFGVLQIAADLNLPINVVGVIPAAENMLSGQALKPGDVVVSMAGQTIEVLNTDAEGRLILADALTYCERFKAEAVIDIATLTGAIIAALGSLASGLMSNSEQLSDDLQKAAQESGDRVWPLPLWEEYREQLNSNVADVANVNEGIGAKSILAGCFLLDFARKFKWAHLDVAGTAWHSGREKMATGRPISLLAQYLINKCG